MNHAASFDYIIVGGGSAGCVLAARLSEDPDRKVLLVEAGGSDHHPILRMPLTWFQAMLRQKTSWGYMSEPEAHADNRQIPAPRGKVIGGCSTINGMMYSRGHPADYDRWAQLGAYGWSHADVLPYFRKSEANWRGASKYHGADGPLTVARHRTDAVIYPRLIEAAQELGFRHLDDFHGDEQEGFSAPDFNIDRGRRASTARMFLCPSMGRPNLTLLSHALVHRVLVEGERVTGIEVEQGDERRTIRCGGEVVLCAGAFNSPKILMLSGIGPEDELCRHGVAVRHALPGVGRNLQDHASLGMQYEASGDFTFDGELRLDRMAISMLRWCLAGTGPAAGLPVGAQGFVRTREGLDRPDLQILVSPVAMDAHLWFHGWRKPRGHVFTISNVLLHPESRGTVTLRSSDPRAKPEIRFNLLATEADRASFRRFVRFTRDFFSTPSAAGLVRRELLPGSDASSDAEIDTFVRQRIGTAMHPVGSCAMGSGGDAVVDPTLKVNGLSGLRVADCSIMPLIVGGNTNAPAIMIAEKAADLILGREAHEVGG